MNKDFLGNDIQVGNYVAFAVRFSSSMWLQIGKVVSQQTGKVTVRSIRRRWNDRLEVSSRNGTLTSLDRVIVIPTVSEDIRAALEAF